jgi:multicomponent Na+:H+ antiporter subunit B
MPDPAGSRRRNGVAEDEWHRPWLVVLIVAAFAVVLLLAVTGLPRETAALPGIARHAMLIALPTWGTTQAVSEIVYGSRGWDTFGETFLLLAAVVSVSLLSRGREPRTEYVGEASAGGTEQAQTDPSTSSDAEDESREPSEDTPDAPLGTPAPERAAAMTVVVQVAARTAALILAVAGVYLFAWGYTPGGGFPAGAVLTGIAILLYTALGHRAVRTVVRPAVLEPVELLGAAAIIAVGLLGLILDGSFLSNWLPLAQQQTIRAGGTLQVFSGAELVEVGTGLTIAVFSLLGMQHDWTPDDAEDGDSGEQQ